MSNNMASVVASPSLRADGDHQAFELKFLVDDALARAVEGWAGNCLNPDPHGEIALEGAYQVTSLYCDTPELDVYYRSPNYKRHKYRIRHYGTSSLAFLERKSKAGDRVWKKRVAIPDEELSRLPVAVSLVDWPGHWFHNKLVRCRLEPSCLISYRRTAFVGSSPEGSLRLTLDRNLRGLRTTSWVIPSLANGESKNGLALLTGKVILEIKFHSALPQLFKELVREMKLNPGRVSKYRRCLDAWGVPAIRREAAHA